MLQVRSNHRVDAAYGDRRIIFLNLLRSRTDLELTYHRIEGHERSRDAEIATFAPRQRHRLGYVQFRHAVDNPSRRRRPVEQHVG
jgi:hypothetical protein